MIIFNVTQDHIDQASVRYDFQKLNGSITGGEGNLSGALGEIVVLEVMRSRNNIISDVSTYDYDMIINGKTVDVKSKRANYPPKPGYKVAVSSWNTKQRCDYYVFTFVMNDMSKVYIPGYLDKDSYYKKALFFKKGDVVLEGLNKGWSFSADCYILNFTELKPLHIFK